MSDPHRSGRCPHGFVPPLCPQCDKPQNLRLGANGNWNKEAQARKGQTQKSLSNMLGVRIGRLVVDAKAEPGPGGEARWHCTCDCGGEIVHYGAYLRKVIKAQAQSRRLTPLQCKRCKTARRGAITTEQRSGVLI